MVVLIEDEHAIDDVCMLQIIRRVKTIALDGMAYGTSNDDLYVTLEWIVDETESKVCLFI